MHELVLEFGVTSAAFEPADAVDEALGLHRHGSSKEGHGPQRPSRR
jgi:hypothetical protein